MYFDKLRSYFHPPALAGWRLYVTNATKERLSLTEAVSAHAVKGF
jgi:hypothetical protein